MHRDARGMEQTPSDKCYEDSMSKYYRICFFLTIILYGVVLVHSVFPKIKDLANGVLLKCGQTQVQDIYLNQNSNDNVVVVNPTPTVNHVR